MMKTQNKGPETSRGLVHCAENSKTDKEIAVTLWENRPVVGSRQVARDFERAHKSVLRRITLLRRETSAQNCADLFMSSTYVDQYGRTQKEYLITRDGFALLVMGFTGAQALSWKLRYIQAFNAMEEQLRRQALSMPQDKALLAAAVLEAEKVMAGLRAEADYAKRVLDSTALIPITGIAKDYGMTADFMNRLLHSLGVQFKKGKRWYLYEAWQDAGYAATNTDTIRKKDGSVKVVESLQWTQKGKRFIRGLLAENNIYPVLERGSHELCD
ncbi:phage regulatory protein, rha family [Eubacterium callanderi]|uniref:Phage regulatory protein, rha family n=3 Tax=Eubacteriaceae TaxID=186806 RepID=A0AB74EV07_9FIRM|nr:phage regulatory protein/antirepressor Ant [Eubacterium callanderi]OEZ04948.1 phage regulatory protein Rha [[Butyribacterium] methylotrophicum]ADO36461.1 antirepressor [Eubacterium callanderi]MCB6657754.1 phage regulatory protein/antirepressor Ant [Eubacterium callanderi]MCB6750963.1 phage regulatory protein/antirepressor Ant [Eubacterium callanderi]MCB7102578.1 phage regulatory protein/antirepressor Ant [Eubacterium callanderi]